MSLGDCGRAFDPVGLNVVCALLLEPVKAL